MAHAVITPLRHLTIWLTLLAFPLNGSAHRLDEYLQSTLVAIEPDGIKLQIHLTPGVAGAAPVLALIDDDHDNVISANEAKAYADLVRHDFTLQLDQHPLELKFTASDFPPPDELRTGWGIIHLEYTTTLGPVAPGAHELAFENRHQTNLSVYLVNAVLPKSSAIQITRQTRNENQSTGGIEFTFHPRSGAKRTTLSLEVVVVILCAGAVIWWRTTRATSNLR